MLSHKGVWLNEAGRRVALLDCGGRPLLSGPP